jgi:predicted nucleic acid-binding protein
MSRFWDSSALYALVAPEPTSGALYALLLEDTDLVAWTLSSVEVTGAIERRRREGSLRVDIEAARENLELLKAETEIVSDLPRVKKTAVELLERHSLRAADALQLAAALTLPEKPAFVCLDKRLSAAARAEGFTVYP